MARRRDKGSRGRAWGFGRPYCKPTHGCGPARRAPDEPPQDAMAIELPPLPYERSALEPHISAETVDFHYGKHQRAYVDRLNELVADTPFAEAALEDIVRGAQGAMYNNAAQAWNHAFYWQCLRPTAGGGGGEPAGALAEAIDKAFGGTEALRKQFDALALGTFGSGWLWLVKRAVGGLRSEANTSELQSLMRISYDVFLFQKQKHQVYVI